MRFISFLLCALGISLFAGGPLRAEDEAKLGDCGKFKSLAKIVRPIVINPLRRAEWENARKLTLSQDVPYFALGLRGHREDPRSLANFTHNMAWRLDHTVSSHVGITLGGPGSSNAALENLFRFVNQGPEIEPRMFLFVEAAQGAPVLLFQLTGVNLDKVKNYRPGYTNAEIRHILAHPELFRATRWFRGDHELTYEEVFATFADIKPNLFE